jgi:outer membrane biosynthesis protein TonB
MDLKRLRRLERLRRQAALPTRAVTQPEPEIAPEPEPEIAPEPEPEPEPDPEPEPEPEPDPEPEIAPEPAAWSMANTKTELIAAAEAAEVTLKTNWTKAQILEALNA